MAKIRLLIHRFKRSIILSTGATAMLAMGAIATPAFAQQGGQSPEAIAAEIEAVEMPVFDRERYSNEPDYRTIYFQERRDALSKKAELIGELWKKAPDYSGIDKLLAERWSILTGQLNEPAKVIEETKPLLKGDHDKGTQDKPITREAWYAYAYATIRSGLYGDKDSRDNAAPTVNAFVDKFPKDERCSRLLTTIAENFTDSDAARKAIYERLLLNYPDDRSSKYWGGKIRQIDGVGKPFELSFENAISGDEISIEKLKGKVVVVDFWATWCGPCVAEMPHMKELYEKYHDQGVEFIGVSLDQPVEQGGLKALREYCESNEIKWPQYYQGNYWSSEFSVSWGINAIPTMFILDKNGDLYSTKARGELDELIPKLLAIQ